MQSKKSYHSLYQKILNWKSQKHDLPRLLSNEKALDIYKKIVHTQEIVTLFELTNLCPIRSITEEDQWNVHLQKKHGDDLGARMAKAFQEIFCFRYEIGLYYWE
jgi:hypothetical protein